MGVLRTIWIFLLILFWPNLYSQNLVINPSFEIYSKLPFLYTNLDSFFCTGWNVPSESSPDYYNTKSKVTDLCVPYNLFGYHPPKSGNAYIGLIPLTWDGYMEHLTGTLSKPLEKNMRYNVSFYIRFAGSSCYFFASHLGIYFSKNKYPLRNYTIPFYDELLTPDIKANIKCEEFIQDTCWQVVKGFYIANGGEKFITLGIFYENEWNFDKKKYCFLRLSNNESRKENFYKKNQNILMINLSYIFNKKFNDQVPYYFIDDVSVEIDTTYSPR